MSEKGIVIRLDGEEYKKVQYMMQALGLKNATDLVRYCIGKQYLYFSNKFPNVFVKEEN